MDRPISQSTETLPKTDINSRYAAGDGNALHLRIPVFIDITTDWPGGAVIVPRAPRHTAVRNAMMNCAKEAVAERALTNHLIHKAAIWLPHWETRITACAKPSCWLFLRGERLASLCGARRVYGRGEKMSNVQKSAEIPCIIIVDEVMWGKPEVHWIIYGFIPWFSASFSLTIHFIHSWLRK